MRVCVCVSVWDEGVCMCEMRVCVCGMRVGHRGYCKTINV